jgi:hypothetical protein
MTPKTSSTSTFTSGSMRRTPPRSYARALLRAQTERRSTTPRTRYGFSASRDDTFRGARKTSSRAPRSPCVASPEREGSSTHRLVQTGDGRCSPYRATAPPRAPRSVRGGHARPSVPWLPHLAFPSCEISQPRQPLARCGQFGAVEGQVWALPRHRQRDPDSSFHSTTRERSLRLSVVESERATDPRSVAPA